jgi:hypothetical protein
MILFRKAKIQTAAEIPQIVDTMVDTDEKHSEITSILA